MPKAKRSRREVMSQEDKIKLRQIKQHEKEWKIKLKDYWTWSDKYKQSSHEEKIKMVKERDLAEYRKEHGLIAETILSDSEQLIFDLKIQAFREMENNPKQTTEDIKLTLYCLDKKEA